MKESYVVANKLVIDTNLQILFEYYAKLGACDKPKQYLTFDQV